jgi:hypothetical protein
VKVKNGLKSSQFLADLTNSAWRILVDFYIRSGRFEKNHLATLQPQQVCVSAAAFHSKEKAQKTKKLQPRNETEK